ncbi:MAG: hypothetical protein FJ100_20020 [Deltaproteobacteria bacterium]|nr:hypothetical protein [Deltaproteobacteria bacterium]
MTRRGGAALALLTIACTSVEPADDLTTRVVRLRAPIATHVEHGRSAPLAFDVPALGQRVRVTVEAPAGVWVAVAGLRGPAGQVLAPEDWRDHDTTRGEACLDCALRLTPGPGAFAVQWPQGPDAGVAPGRWQVRVVAWTRPGPDGALSPWTGVATATVDALVGAVPPRGVRVPVRVLVPVSLASAATLAEVGAAVGEARSLLGQAGVDLDPVTVHTVADRWQQFDPGRDAADARQLAEEAQDLPPGLRMALVGRIREGAGPPMRGTCPQVPGAAVAHAPTVVAVALGGPATWTAQAAAHEVGHWLGLYHPTEAALTGPLVGLTDPIADTTAGDPANLMHPNGHPEAARQWTPGQAAVAVGQTVPWVALD